MLTPSSPICPVLQNPAAGEGSGQRLDGVGAAGAGDGPVISPTEGKLLLLLLTALARAAGPHSIASLKLFVVAVPAVAAPLNECRPDQIMNIKSDSSQPSAAGAVSCASQTLSPTTKAESFSLVRSCPQFSLARPLLRYNGGGLPR